MEIIAAKKKNRTLWINMGTEVIWRNPVSEYVSLICFKDSKGYIYIGLKK
jgi:tartrate dehydratase beta subunit/fumarate hydratase class I family protein